MKYEFDNIELMQMLDRLRYEVPEKIPDALVKMADHLVPKLIEKAPYDGTNNKTKHLKQVIKRGRVKNTNNKLGKCITIFVSPRGIPNAQQGPRAKANWDKDKHVFKLVVAEYGSSKVAARPFWGETVARSEDEILDIANDIINGEVDRIAK